MPRRTNPRPQPSVSTESWALDDIDRRIVAELQADARLSLADLGRRIGLSAPATGERVRRLEESGVITGYHAQVDPLALGYPIAAVLRIRPAVQQLSKIPPLARESPEVVECQRVTGEDCFLLRVHVRSMQHLEEVLDRFVIYGQTTTSIVQSSAVPRRGLSVS
jgi:Lrp/AsnC family leucine-responsive transcriptional regulator